MGPTRSLLQQWLGQRAFQSFILQPCQYETLRNSGDQIVCQLGLLQSASAEVQLVGAHCHKAVLVLRHSHLKQYRYHCSTGRGSFALACGSSLDFFVNCSSSKPKKSSFSASQKASAFIALIQGQAQNTRKTTCTVECGGAKLHRPFIPILTAP